MAILRFCDVKKDFISIEEWRAARQKVSSAAIISDSMEALPHPCDGKIYDSKSTFRKVTKAHGCEETGNDKKYYFGDE